MSEAKGLFSKSLPVPSMFVELYLADFLLLLLFGKFL
jgi:hypothetical protein